MGFLFGKKNNKVQRKPARTNSVKSAFVRKKDKVASRVNVRDRKEFKNPLEYIFDLGINHDKRLFYAFIAIVIIGVIAIFSSTIVFAHRYQGDRFYYLMSHLKLLGAGSILALAFYFMRTEFLTRVWFWLSSLIICVALLGYLLYLSFTSQVEAIDGATRWLNVGGFQFQPSEFAKLTFLVFVAGFLGRISDNFRNASDFIKRNFMPFLLSLGTVTILILLSRNLGTALVVGFIAMASYWSIATNKFQRAGFMALCILIVIGGTIFGIYESYRADRIAVWINYLQTNDTLIEEKDGSMSRSNRSYQLDQVLTAIGSGGVFGLGLGESIGKYYFPKTSAGDDSIFGIMGEELGFIMVSAILLLYLYLVFRLLTLANMIVENRTYFLFLVGIASWIGFQMFVHVGANVGVIPLTGQTLPFISLGGSSVISLMTAMGLALNVSKQVYKTSTKETPREKRKSFTFAQ